MILKFDRNGEAVRSGEVVEIGGEGRYVSVCRRHWTQGEIGPAAQAVCLRRRRTRNDGLAGECQPKLFTRARGCDASNASIRRVASIFV